jgi:hypothetical protein
MSLFGRNCGTLSTLRGTYSSNCFEMRIDREDLWNSDDNLDNIKE